MNRLQVIYFIVIYSFSQTIHSQKAYKSNIIFVFSSLTWPFGRRQHMILLRKEKLLLFLEYFSIFIVILDEFTGNYY